MNTLSFFSCVILFIGLICVIPTNCVNMNLPLFTERKFNNVQAGETHMEMLCFNLQIEPEVPHIKFVEDLITPYWVTEIIGRRHKLTVIPEEGHKLIIASGIGRRTHTIDDKVFWLNNPNKLKKTIYCVASGNEDGSPASFTIKTSVITERFNNTLLAISLVPFICLAISSKKFKFLLAIGVFLLVTMEEREDITEILENLVCEGATSAGFLPKNSDSQWSSNLNTSQDCINNGIFTEFLDRYGFYLVVGFGSIIIFLLVVILDNFTFYFLLACLSLGLLYLNIEHSGESISAIAGTVGALLFPSTILGVTLGSIGKSVDKKEVKKEEKKKEVKKNDNNNNKKVNETKKNNNDKKDAKKTNNKNKKNRKNNKKKKKSE
eukprot:TRINITY_DN1948_c0_g1_i1.p1 TRINITY_DN1948_c0_g1~~TRINITY_DN1948_c0_g1_i1.p1  ORF type:complete len:378 (+),score=114.85 TRINITY_DN1948_c0_g1_i1:95-1228(+)